jgi:hypothetical protein
MLQSCTRAVVEGLSPNNLDPVKSRNSYAEFIAALLAFVLAIIILAFIGKFLWNDVIVELFSFAKPAKSMWHILGLFIFASLLKC